jgi:hypothetical protein
MDCSLDWRKRLFSLGPAACASSSGLDLVSTKGSHDMTAIHVCIGARRAAIVAAVLIACAAPAQAQQPSPAAIASAKEVITMKGAAKMFDPLIPGVIEQAKNLFLQSNPGLVKDLNEVAATLRTEYAARRDEVGNEIARLYATHFTEQELKELAAFYKSPLGKKMIEEEPKAIDQTMAFAQSWGDKLSEEIIGKMRREMKKRGHDI